MNSKEFLTKMSRLQTWTYAPTSVAELRDLLSEFTDSEIGIAAQVYAPGSAAGRLAWIEYARRRRYLDFDFHNVSLKDRTALAVSAPALPIHENPILSTDKKDD